jgi:hypothetical protein
VDLELLLKDAGLNGHCVQQKEVAELTQSSTDSTSQTAGTENVAMSLPANHEFADDGIDVALIFTS